MIKLSGREEYPIYFGAKPEMLQIARELRKNMTQAEIILWNKLRNRKLNGFRFRRQHPINVFVVDFFCYESMLVIEVDGDVHNDITQKDRDIERAKILKEFGIKEIRFKNNEVLNDISSVLEKIKMVLTNH